MYTKLLPAALAALAITALAPSAQAAESKVLAPNAVLVPYGDLDIGRESGANVLLNRIELAADKACGRRPFTLELKEQQAYVSCTTESVENAVVDVDAPMLTAAYERGGGRIGVVTVSEGYYDSGAYVEPQRSITMEPIPNP